MTDLTPAEQAAADALMDTIGSSLTDAARAVVSAVRSHLATEPPVHDGIHHYLSTGCLHGDMTLPDGRTGHQYCQGMTGMAGMKRPATCKFCDAPCQCPCHQTTPDSLTDDDLAAMRDRSQGIDCAREAYDSAEDVPRLLDEVDRLRAERDRLYTETLRLGISLAETIHERHQARQALGATQRDRAAALDVAADLTAERDQARAEIDRQRHEREKYTERWDALDLQRLAALELHALPFCETCNDHGPCETRRALDGDGVAAETETREQHLTALREAGRRLGESFQQLGESIRDGAAKARAAREAEETPDVDGWTIYPTTDGGGVMVSHDTDADQPTLTADGSIPLGSVLAFIADADVEPAEDHRSGCCGTCDAIHADAIIAQARQTTD